MKLVAYRSVNGKRCTLKPEGFYNTVATVYRPEYAALIVRAVNCHDELLQALELAQATIERVNPKVHNSCEGTLYVLRAAIRKAEGRE